LQISKLVDMWSFSQKSAETTTGDKRILNDIFGQLEDSADFSQKL